MKIFAALCPVLAAAALVFSACRINSGAPELTPLGPSLIEMTATASPVTSTSADFPAATLTRTPISTRPAFPTAAPSRLMVALPAASPTQPPPAITPTPCDGEWFTPHAPSGSCTTGPAVQLEAAYQPFEHGAMLWRKGRGYLILPFNPPTQTQSGIVSFYPDEVTIYRDTSGVPWLPPDGLFAPVSGFGLVWRGDIFEEPGYGLKPLLGWATAPEAGYTLTEQSGSMPLVMGALHSASLMTYLTLPDGRLLSLSRLAMPNQMTSMQFITP